MKLIIAVSNASGSESVAGGGAGERLVARASSAVVRRPSRPLATLPSLQDSRARPLLASPMSSLKLVKRRSCWEIFGRPTNVPRPCSGRASPP